MKRFLLFMMCLLLMLSLIIGCSSSQIEDLNNINVQQNENFGSDKVEGNKLAEYRELDPKNIPDVSEDTLENVVANIYRYIYQIEEIKIIKKEPIFITKPEDAHKGYLIEASINLVSQVEKKVLAVLMKKTDNLKDGKEGYELVFKYVYLPVYTNESDITFPKHELIDIDSDGCCELLLETAKGDDFNHEDVTIYKYKEGQFARIFNEGLRSRYTLNHIEYWWYPEPDAVPVYFYNNSYKLVKNRENPSNYDICFSIKTQDGTDIKKAEAVGKFIIPKPVQEEVVFTFNGDKYVAEKAFYNYKQDENAYKAPYCTRKNNGVSLGQKNRVLTENKQLWDNLQFRKEYSNLPDDSRIKFGGLVREPLLKGEYVDIDERNLPDLTEETLKKLVFAAYFSWFCSEGDLNITNIEPMNIATDGILEKGYLIEGIVYQREKPDGFDYGVAVVKERNNPSNGEEKYEVVLGEWGMWFMKYDLLDIDSDGGHEILIRKYGCGASNPAEFVDVGIFKYNNGEFSSIFEEGLYLYNSRELECYSNSYRFVKNKQNPSYYDLIYRINTQHDMEWCKEIAEAIEEHDGEKREIPKPVKEEVIFSFNGERYERTRK